MLQLESLLPLGQESAGVSTPWAPDPIPRIGKYEIVTLVGKGAMGAVYQAHDPFLERDVALKVMLPQIANDPEQKQRFEREARAVARLTHRNVVMVFDLGYHTDGSPYIAMELLRGRDLLQTLRTGPPLSLETKISVVLQVLEGLSHAHKIGIVHRDIKPANVFVVDDGVVKIMDFGIARLPTAATTAAGVVFGTANYMSPEQVVGGPLDGRSDLFSVGSMLCELLTDGHRPFDSDTMMTTLFKIVHQEPVIALPDGPEFNGLLPILSQALAKKPDNRFATAADFAAALQGFLDKKAAPVVTAPFAAVPETVALRSPALAPGADREGRIPAGVTAPGPRADPTSLFRLLRAAYVGSKSGHLHCTDPSARRSLRLVKGRIVHGTSDVPGEHLGDVMVRFGLLSQSDLHRAVAVVLAERKRLGAVLADLRLATPERLQQGVALHVREILYGVLGRPGSSFAFEELTDNGLEMELASDLSTAEVILEATRRVQDPELVRKVLGDIDRVLVLSSNPLLRAQRIPLAAADGFVLSRIDGVLTAREVISLIPIPPTDTERSLFGLLSTGTVDYLDTLPRRPASPRTGPARVVPPTPPRAASVAAPAAPPVAPCSPPVLVKGATDESPSAPAAVREDVRRTVLDAHEGLSRKNHFEVLGISRDASETEVRDAYRHFARLLHPDVSHGPGLGDLADKQEAVFIRVCQAYEVLRDPAARAKYESRLARSRSASPPSAPKPAPGPERPVVRAATASPDPPQVPFDGAKALLAAEQLLKEQQYWDAIQALDALIPRLQGELRLRARVTLARAYLKNPKWTKRAEEVLQSVLVEDPSHAEACFVLGGLYAGSQLMNRASAMYRKTLELDPRHSEARGALAAIEEEHKAERASAGSLGRLFRKH